MFRYRIGKGIMGIGPLSLLILFKKRKINDPCKRVNPLLFLFDTSQIKLVTTVLGNRIFVGDNGKRFLFNRSSESLDNVGDHVLDNLHHIATIYKTHLHIKLGMLKSPVSTQIFIPETPCYLKIPFKSRYHQKLFVLLR